jgi:multimeric flavodoxin WrbA
MKAAILNGSKPGDAPSERILRILLDALKEGGWEPEPFPLARMNIAYCRGCFGCWLLKPGICLLKDDGQELATAVIGSDLTVFFTPVTFGGYSPELKKGLDRLIGLISPFFMKVSDEVHHQPRYERYPCLMGVGVQERQDEESRKIFSSLVERNAINFHAPGYGVKLFAAGQDEISIQEDLKTTLAELGEKR